MLLQPIDIDWTRLSVAVVVVVAVTMTTLDRVVVADAVSYTVEVVVLLRVSPCCQVQEKSSALFRWRNIGYHGETDGHGDEGPTTDHHKSAREPGQLQGERFEIACVLVNSCLTPF